MYIFMQKIWMVNGFFVCIIESDAE